VSRQRRGGNPYTGDSRTRAARSQGFPARSVFKLEEIDRKVRLLRPGQRVLDLGAAPGSWSLYASHRVGAQGRIFAIDLQSIDQRFADNVTVLQGDVFEIEDAIYTPHAPFDVVLSDMAPATTGAKDLDRARSHDLFMRALAVALRFGCSGSSFAAKLFMGSDFQVAKQAVAAAYTTTRVIRPAGTRQRSSEVFVVGLQRKADR
jgi:23S rRNA (uridine2552-2'-O)-methyltransferase